MKVQRPPKIKAFLLSAGLGTRLRPLTLDIPKCLVPVQSEPILLKWLRALRAIDCESILINTHYLADKVDQYIKSLPREYSQMISVSYEPQLLGTAGSLIYNRDFFDCDIGLLIHVDNLMVEGLQPFLDAHMNRPSECDITMLTFETNDPESCGIVRLNNNSVITDFFEKSHEDHGCLANAAVFAFNPNFLNSLLSISDSFVDFSKDVIPHFLNKIYAYKTTMPFVDIGTPDRLNYANSVPISNPTQF